MEKIVIEGGKKLNGIIEPQGSKNAALPIIFATVAINGISEIGNIPDIGDVRVALDIISGFGAKIERSDKRLIVDTRNLVYKTPECDAVSKIRASSYLMGSCICRFGRAEILSFGGCNFDARPIDLHLYAASELGAKISGNVISAKKLRGAEIAFSKASVGATINAILMASSADGVTRIYGGAQEPHVLALIDFLRSAGADIRTSAECVTVKGASLHDGECEVIPDMIEVGTYLFLGPLTDGCVAVDKRYAEGLESAALTLNAAGLDIKSGDYISFSGSAKRQITVETAAYPGYPTDLQPQIAPLMAKFQGGYIKEQVWRGRFGYLEQLQKFGLRYERQESSAWIFPSELKCGKAFAPDLRGGAACIMSALATKGRSEIYNPDVILRGYSDLKEKLCALGAYVDFK